jgi:hypothetical protein
VKRYAFVNGKDMPQTIRLPQTLNVLFMRIKEPGTVLNKHGGAWLILKSIAKSNTAMPQRTLRKRMRSVPAVVRASTTPR